MQQSNQKSIDDYRNIVKMLKLKILKLQKKNEELEKKLQEPIPQQLLTSEEVTKRAVELNNKVTKIQANWKGLKQRNDYKDSLNKQQVKGDQGTQEKQQFNVNTNEYVMKEFSKAAKKMGLTPEMVFRAADKDSAGTVLVDDFRIFLSKLKLGLSHSQISRLMFLCDEDCSGVIRKDEFYNCLAAYEVNEETNTTGTRSFAQQSLIKLATQFVKLKINPADAFNACDKKCIGFISCQQISEYVFKLQGNELNDKEIVSVFKFLDLEKQGRCERENFISQLQKAMRVVANEQGLQISTIFAQTKAERMQLQQQLQQDEMLQSNALQVNKQASTLKSPGKKSKKNKLLDKSGNSISNLDKSQLSQNKKSVVVKILEPNIIDVIQKLEKAGYTLDIFFLRLIEVVKNFNMGVFFYDIETMMKALKSKVKRDDVLHTFRALDMDCIGAVSMQNCVKFYLKNKREELPLDVVFQIIAKYLLTLKWSIDKYIREINISDPQIDMDQLLFNKFLEDYYKIDKPSAKIAMFQYMTNKGSDSKFKFIEFFNKIKEYMGNNAELDKSSMLNKSANKLNKSNLNTKDAKKLKKEALSSAAINVDEYEAVLNKLVPKGKVCFSRRKVEEDREHPAKRYWTTIFNDELSALKFANSQVKELQKTGEKWEDPDFGPTKTDTFGSKSMYVCDNDIPAGCPQPEEVRWLRPSQIVKELKDNGDEKYQSEEGQTISFLSGGASSNDVKQSAYLGNCWFVSALSLIASDDKLLMGYFNPDPNELDKMSPEEAEGLQSGVYPPIFHNLSQYGIYIMRFFKNYKWRYVMIDDKLPCKENGEIVYGHCRMANETWVSLIEKAYAKIHNCYQALVSGDIAQGLADMTGMVAEKVKLEHEKLKSQNQKDELWQRLLQAKETGTMMGCSAEGETEGFMEVNGENSGLMSGHAYSVIDVFTIDYTETEKQEKEEAIKRGEKKKNYHGNHRFVRVRNPWGYGEWKLKWSESKEYQEKLLAIMPQIQQYYEKEAERFRNELKREPLEGYTFDKDDTSGGDGTFIMCYKDWRTIYSNLFLCVNFPDDWQGKRIKDAWKDDTCNGVVKKDAFSEYALNNPQFIIEINRKNGRTKLFLSLGQRDGRMYEEEKYPFERVNYSMLLCIFKLDQKEIFLEKFVKEKMIASSDKLNLRREVTIESLEIENGRYAVIPCTKNKGEKGKFYLNIYYNREKEGGITFSKMTGDKQLKIDVIAEEEEAAPEVNGELRMLLKKNATSILF